MTWTTRQLLRNRRTNYRPPPDLKVSQWADRYRHLSSEASAEAGPWHNSRNPMLVEPMDALSPHDPCERVVCMFSSQVGKTEVGLNFGGYQMHQDPGPMLVVQPSLRPMGEVYAKDRIAPMLRDSPALAEIFTNTKSKDRGNTIYNKVYPGGQLSVAGANSPSQLASRPIRYLHIDELDRYQVTKEGDAFVQAVARTKSFHNRKILITSSPSFPDVGVHAEYQKCLQHERQVQCQHCDEWTYPEHKHFTYKRDEFGDADDVNFVCPHCGVQHDENEEALLKAAAQWVVVNEKSPIFKGYRANQFVSPFCSWRETINEFLQAKDDPAKLQAVVNTAFCEVWEGVGEKIEAEQLYERREVYPMSLDGELQVPNDADGLFLTIDTQDDWLDCQVFAVNARRQSWGMLRTEIRGPTDEPDVYDELDKLLAQQFPTEDGGTMAIYAAMIDVKGHRQKHVLEYLHGRKYLKLYGYAGQSDKAKNQIARSKYKLDDGSKKWVWVYNVRTNDFKRTALTYMTRESHAVGACHYPKGFDGGEVAGYNFEHFEQECAETLETRIVRGVAHHSFKQNRKRNEAFDQRHMLYALMQISKPTWHRKRTESPPPKLVRQREKAAAPLPKNDEPRQVTAVSKPKRKRQPVIEGAEFIRSRSKKRSSSNWISKRR